MTADVQQLRRQDLANSELIALLEKTLKRAQSGEIRAILLVSESREGFYEYSKKGFSFLEAIGLYDRAKYDLHKQWDQG